ncbi:MAG: Tn3 family transposase [Methanocellales archaeon]|nr:Tn3 family transposase [Methanocellales archaeon]
MPGQFLTKSEREILSSFPHEVAHNDAIIFFTLSSNDMEQVQKRRENQNRLGFALQLGTLRYLGFCPDDFTAIPSPIVEYVANQLNINASIDFLKTYGNRAHTRTDHFQEVQNYLGYRKANSEDITTLSTWLLERALEHDKPTLLFQLVCDKLQIDKIVRPGITSLERMVITARQQAQEETYRRLNFLLTEERKTFLDKVLLPNKTTGRTPLFWLRHAATSNTPKSILGAIEKITFLQGGGVDHWDLSSINPNRRKSLAQLGRKSTNQALQRAIPQRRYPILITFLRQSLEDIIDEVVDLFDRCLADCYARSRRNWNEFRLSIAKTANEKLRIFREIGHILLDSAVSDLQLRESIYNRVPKEDLLSALEECDRLIRPKDDKFYDYLANRYSYIREFTPKFLETISFQSNKKDDPLMKALKRLQELNSDGKRKIPENAPLDFAPKSWLPYLTDKKGKIVRRYYEISALWELRSALRSGDIWIKDSRRYADPETYLIPKDQWPTLRPDVCRLLGIPEDGEQRLKQRQKDLEEIFLKLNKAISSNENIRIEKGSLLVSPLKAEELSESTKQLQKLITERLPQVELTDLLIEVDSWTHFTDNFEHAGGNQPKTKDLLVHLYASIMAQACNFGLSKMAEISDISYRQLAWCTNWYLREETLQTAINNLVNFQYNQPLSRFWGGGTLSSSDGQRFPVPVKARNTTALPRYFGYGRGLTFYSWTSDQFSQYGSKVIPTTARDATYVLDAILDNETELQIVEHTTDTAGYTELIFALFDLLGMQFSPRIRDIGDQRIYRIDKGVVYNHLEPLLKSSINQDLILKNWDDILRVVASIKLGWVTASLFISKLQSYSHQNIITKTIQEYGRLIKSIYIPNYLSSEDYRRRISIQLNKGESLHDLRQFLLFANEGKIRKSQIEDQVNQTSCLTLLTNAIIVWNTRYVQAIIDQLKNEVHNIQDSDLAHISPCRFDHINKYGKYSFDVDKELNRKELRTLRQTLIT